ncbi:MAG: hypothetical protein NC133_00815 [Prevotella sp.]|nr:hypothetical protein [Prevotella sp.]
MDWLWLFLSVVGLGLLWLLIMGVEKLTERLKAHDEARQRAAQRIAERTAVAEADLLAKQYAKASAQDYIANADADDPANAEKLAEAINTLSADELVDSLTMRAFGAPEGTDGITAKQSAFDHLHAQKVVARGNGVTPVKVKSSGKSALSKSEQKMLKKIKQGD